MRCLSLRKLATAFLTMLCALTFCHFDRCISAAFPVQINRVDRERDVFTTAKTQTVIDCYNSNFRINVSRERDGDVLSFKCLGNCDELCGLINASQIEWETGCRCKCLNQGTFWKDRCIQYLQDSKKSMYFMQDVNKSDTSNSHNSPVSVRNHSIGFRRGTAAGSRDAPSSPPPAPSKHCVVEVKSESNTSASFPNNLFNIHKSGKDLHIQWMGVEKNLLRLRGHLLRLSKKCGVNSSSTYVALKVAGSLIHSMNISALPYRIKMPVFNTSTQEFTMPGNKSNVTSTTLSPDERRVEKIISGLCIAVGVVLTVWLLCFFIEKKFQRKHHRNSSSLSHTSSSRTYSYEVSSVRRTLMEQYDMPMIKINSLETGDNGNNVRSSNNSGPKEDSQKSEDSGEEFSSPTEVTSPDPGYSASSSDDLNEKGESSSQGELLEVPNQSPTREEFAKWIPTAKVPQSTETKSRYPFSGSASPSHSRRNSSPKQSPMKSPPQFKKFALFALRQYQQGSDGATSSPSKHKLHKPILKSAMKSSQRKKNQAAVVRVETPEERAKRKESEKLQMETFSDSCDSERTLLDSCQSKAV